MDSRGNSPGFPDLVLAHPDLGLIFAELKPEGGHASEAQRSWLEVLARCGAEVQLWRPSDWQRIRNRLEGRE